MKSIGYTKTPTKPLIKRKWIADQTKDITKLSTFRIAMFIYKRHEVTILYTLVFTLFGLICAHTAGLL